MERMNKTLKKVDELIETIGKEFGEVTARNEVIAKVAAIKEIGDQVDRNLAVFEKHRIMESPADYDFEPDEKVRQARFEASQRVSAGICILIEYARQHPEATVEDLQKFKIELPPTMDINTLVLIARCSKIADKYVEAKPLLTSALLNLVTPAKA
jgi:hypothetical protein